MDNGASSYRRYLDGEEEAFDEIVIALYDPLVLFLCRYVKDPHTAEDYGSQPNDRRVPSLGA